MARIVYNDIRHVQLDVGRLACINYLTGVFATISVSGTHHLVVDDDVDALGLVPVLALAIVDDGHVDHL